MEPFRAKYGHALRLLLPDDLEQVKAVAVRTTHRKGRTVGEPKYGQGGVFAVVAGAVVLNEQVDGKLVRQSHRRRRGDLFTVHHPDGSIDRGTKVQAAQDETVVYSVSWQEILALCRSLPHVAEAMLMVEDSLLRERTEFAIELETCDAPARLMYALHLLALDTPNHVIHESRVEIAEEASMTRQEMTKHVRMLRQQSLVETDRYQSITVPDLQRLLRAFRKRQAM